MAALHAPWPQHFPSPEYRKHTYRVSQTRTRPVAVKKKKTTRPVGFPAPPWPRAPRRKPRQTASPPGLEPTRHSPSSLPRHLDRNAAPGSNRTVTVTRGGEISRAEPVAPRSRAVARPIYSARTVRPRRAAAPGPTPWSPPRSRRRSSRPRPTAASATAHPQPPICSPPTTSPPGPPPPTPRRRLPGCGVSRLPGRGSSRRRPWLTACTAIAGC